MALTRNLVPIEAFVAELLPQVQELRVEPKDECLRQGALTTLLTARALLESHEAFAALYIGCIEDTKNYGDSSVSMGAANGYFEAHHDAKTVTFINCGKDGNKYQQYTIRENPLSNDDCERDPIISAGVEYKQEDAYSPQGLVYLSNDGLRVEVIDDDNFNAEVDLLKENLEKYTRIAGSSGDVWAFVTGPIRAINDIDSTIVETELARYFGTIGTVDGAYVLSQEDEARFEYIGTQTMYDQLTDSDLLPEHRIVGVWGIGQDSCQFTFGKYKASLCMCCTESGLVDPHQLSLDTFDLMRQTIKTSDWFREIIANCRYPVIALKSGCLRFFTEHLEGKAMLAGLVDKLHGSVKAEGGSPRRESSVSPVAATADLLIPDDSQGPAEITNKPTRCQ